MTEQLNMNAEMQQATPVRAKGAAGLLQLLSEYRRRAASVLVLALSLPLGYHVVMGRNGVLAYQQKKREEKSLRLEIDQLERDNTKLRSHVARLKDDPDAIEREARERLHYTRDGEVIYTLPERKADTQK